MGAGARGRLVAPVQADHRGGSSGEAGHRVRGVSGSARGRVVGVAGDMQQTGGGLGGEVGGAPVAVGTALTVGGGGDVDQVRVDGAEVVVTESERGQLVGLAGFDQDIGGAGELAELSCSALRFEIDDERVFVGVEVQVLIRTLRSRLVVNERRLPSCTHAAGRLDEGNMRAEIGEQSPGEGCAIVGEVEYADAVEREWVVGRHGLLLAARGGVTRYRCWGGGRGGWGGGFRRP